MKTRSRILVYLFFIITPLALLAISGVVNRIYLPLLVAQGAEPTSVPTDTPSPPEPTTYSDQPMIIYAKYSGTTTLQAGTIVDLSEGETADFMNAPFIMNANKYNRRALPGVAIGPALVVGSSGNQYLEPTDGSIEPNEYVAVVVQGIVKVSLSNRFCSSGPSTTSMVVWYRDGNCWGSARYAVINTAQGAVFARDSTPILGIGLQSDDPSGMVWFYVNTTLGKAS